MKDLGNRLSLPYRQAESMPDTKYFLNNGIFLLFINNYLLFLCH